MLQQILTHTPIYVWIILAVLISRGVSALRERELPVRALFVMPLVMLAIALPDLGAKFGWSATALGAWAAGAAIAALLAWRFGARRVTATAPGQVRVRGSWVPLALMLAVFFAKYAAAVLLAVLPQASHDLTITVAVCALFGVFNGIFLGRLARDLADIRLGTSSQLASAAA